MNIEIFSRIIKIDRLKEEYHAYKKTEKDIIKQTVPLLKEKGTEITSIFYPKMFKDPELLNMFNQTNQKRGMQSSALAQAVMAAAVNIDNSSVIEPSLCKSHIKHCA